MATFRARQPEEEMGAYLAAKQASEIQTTGTSGVILGTPVSAINSANIQPNVEILYKSPEETSVTPPPEIPTPTYEATPKETELSTLIKELTESSGLAGEKAAYQVEQEKVAGLETLKSAEADYTAQLTQLKADYANIENKMQLSAEGRGMTAYGLAPLSMAEQRKISIQANTVSALLAATQGKITFAQSQVDRAVNNKYAQAEADRKAKLENLELLSKDPTLTVEQQKRANVQTAILKKEDEASTKKKEDSKTIMDWAVKAAANGATPEQAQAISKIAMSDNPDLQAAMTLYTPFAKEKIKVSTSIIEVGGRKLLINDLTGETIKDLGTTGGIGAITTLDELAKLGYVRWGSVSGVGWDFFKDGQPIRAEQIVQETGIPLATLLAGSGNPADIKKIKELRGTTGGGGTADDFYNNL